MFQLFQDVDNMKTRRLNRNKMMIVSFVLITGAMIFVGYRSVSDYGNDNICSNSTAAMLKEEQLSNITLENSPPHIFIFDATQVAHKYPGGYKPFEQCPNKYCFLTNNVLYANKADAVIFSDMYASDLPTPRPTGQIWILRLLESPEHTMSLKEFNDKKAMTSIEGEIEFLEKSKMVAWFVSNCFTKNDRINYARRLSERIEVDIFGSCEGQILSKNQEQQVLKQYRFYLAFENSNCKEYITEKLWRALKHSVIPVVMGAPRKDYEKYAPPSSFIHVDDFKSHIELALYLRKVASDPELYNSYLKWKRVSYLTDSNFHCNLCNSLHNPTPKVYNDLDSFWFRPSDCEASKLVITA